MERDAAFKNGSAAAAILAAALGCAVLGTITVLSELSLPIKSAMDWWKPVGPLSGKAGVAVLSWLSAWWLLDRSWKHRGFPKLPMLWFWLLIVWGALGTFPPIFDAF